MNNYRNTATFVANFVLLLLVTFFLSLKGSHESYFFMVAVLIVCIGSITTLFFLSNVREVMLVEKCRQYRQ